MSAWSLLFSPLVLTVKLQSGQNAPLPIPPEAESRSFGNVLKPRYIFGADSLDQ